MCNLMASQLSVPGKNFESLAKGTMARNQCRDEMEQVCRPGMNWRPVISVGKNIQLWK